jgi:hypothetical protein
MRKVNLVIAEGWGHNGGAMKLPGILLALATVLAACGGGTGSPSTSPTAASSSSGEPQASASPSGSPLPLEGGYGVLVTPTSEANYTVTLVGADAKVASSAQVTSPTKVTCGDAAGAVLPFPVSTSNDRLYFLDAQGVVHFLTPSGETGRATTLPVGAARRSSFSVSPDDLRIAVVVSDYTASGASTSLYVEDLNGGTHHKVIFTESGAFGLWPIGWHGTSLVVAKVPACANGVGPGCCGPQELHVVDPATAARRFTLGGPTCIIAGPPSAAGAVCETDAQANVLDWTATTTRSFAVQGQTPAYLSPNGNQAALDKGTPTNFLDTVVEGTHTTFTDLQTCGWIDSSRVLATDRQGRPRVGDIATGATTAVSAQGTCAGRIPGGL